MPVYYKHNEEGTASSIQVEPFLPIHDLDLTKFKKHIEFLKDAEKKINDAIQLMNSNFYVLEFEFKDYFYNKHTYKHPIDVGRDMDSIIQCLDVMDFARKRLIESKEFIQKRMKWIYAIGIYRAIEMLDQSYEKTIAQLEVPKEYIEDVLMLIDEIDD